MRALVVGGNGFIGSHLVDKLLKAGDVVRVLDRSLEKFRDPLPQIEYVTGDFSDPFILGESLSDIDVVYHLASTTVPSTSNMDPVRDVQDNLVGAIHLIDQMLKAKVSRIVFLSSGGTVYGTPEQIPISEDHPLLPICSYGIVKSAIEQYLYMYRLLHQISTIVLRPSNPYGPRQGHLGVQGLIATFLNKIIKNEPLIVWGDGGIIRDYLYVEDLADLISCAGRSQVNGTFNAGSGTGYTINDIIEIISQVAGMKPTVIYEKGRAFDVAEVVLDITRAKEHFHWIPETPITRGIDRQFQWMKSK